MHRAWKEKALAEMAVAAALKEELIGIDVLEAMLDRADDPRSPSRRNIN